MGFFTKTSFKFEAYKVIGMQYILYNVWVGKDRLYGYKFMQYFQRMLNQKL
jgi:hypothetical protein